MNIDLDKNNQKIIGAIIKYNRIKQNMNQKTLSQGICVPSYLSRIENGDISPSDNVISIIFNKLGLTFNNSPEFIEKNRKAFDLFFHELHFNEFDYTIKQFEEIKSKEQDFITSPLIIDYFLVKLARYCSTSNRDEFENANSLLLSTFDLLSNNQKFIYNFYVGVDTLNISGDHNKGKEYIMNALSYKETGHCYFWLSYVYRIENNPIKAYDNIKKALDIYVAEGNIISIMSSYEKIAEVYFMLNNYSDAIQYIDMALNIAHKLKNNYHIEHLNSLLAWSYYRLENYDKAMRYLNLNSGLIDHRMIIPDALIECLIYFNLNNRVSLKTSISKLKSDTSIEHLGSDLAKVLFDFFNFYLEHPDYIKNPIWEGLLIYIIESTNKLVEVKKVFSYLLKEFYIKNRRYKDALSINS